MSEATKNLTEFYDDIDLCYKVMGLTFSDPPDKVDRVYNSLVAEYTKSMQSADPGGRLAAKDNLEQVKELYERITNSMIYKDYAREYEKYKLIKEAQKSEKQLKAEAEKDLMVNCPYCAKMINPAQKVCIYCHGKILTPMELLMAKLFTTRNLIVLVVVVLLVVAGVFVALNPQILNR